MQLIRFAKNFINLIQFWEQEEVGGRVGGLFLLCKQLHHWWTIGTVWNCYEGPYPHEGRSVVWVYG